MSWRYILCPLIDSLYGIYSTCRDTNKIEESISCTTAYSLRLVDLAIIMTSTFRSCLLLSSKTQLTHTTSSKRSGSDIHFPWHGLYLQPQVSFRIHSWYPVFCPWHQNTHRFGLNNHKFSWSSRFCASCCDYQLTPSTRTGHEWSKSRIISGKFIFSHITYNLYKSPNMPLQGLLE